MSHFIIVVKLHESLHSITNGNSYYWAIKAQASSLSMQLQSISMLYDHY